MTIKAILFDFDDTLGNREEYSHRTYEQRIDEIMPDGDPWLKETAIQIALVYDQHGDVPKKYVRDRLLDLMNVDLGEDFPKYWPEHQWTNVVLYDDAMPTVTELKKRGYLVGILSNGDSFGQHRKISKCGLDTVMDVITVSGDTDTAKPDPEIFYLTADKLGVKPEECAFVGDMFNRDVYGAHLAGMMPVWIWPHGTRYTRIPEVTVIHRLSELLDLFPGQAAHETGEETY